MGLFDRLFNKKEEKTETPSIQDDSRDSAVMSIIEDGRKRFEYYQAKRNFGQFYDTTRVVVNTEPRIVEGRILYDCLVSWYGRDDAVYLMDEAEVMGGRRDIYEHVVAGIDPEKMQADGRYLQMIMTDLLEQKRVNKYLERGMKEESELGPNELACGRYIGEIEQKPDGTYRKVFGPRVGKAEHNTEHMKQERQAARDQIAKWKAERIARKQAEIARLQAEIDEETR